jgi:ABC-type Fe3+/spermidine/putrescine transport system ATPase subunit
VVKKFGSFRAVDGVSLDIRAGEFFALLGPSGCGKTTLLRMLAGFETPTSGTIRINGQVVNDLPPQQRKIGIVFQDYAIFPTMTVFDNIAYGLKIKKLDKAEINRSVMEYLGLVGLVGYEKRMPSQLSGGQQQRTAIARALVNNPRIVFADEPTGNLDSHTGEAILSLFRKLSTEGRTIVLVTHDPEIAAVTPRRIEIRDGRIAEKIDLTLAGLDRTNADRE